VRKLIQLFLCSLIAVALPGAPNPDDYVRLLIPVYGGSSLHPLPGAAGSDWYTSLRAYNANDFFVQVDATPDLTCAITCPPPLLESGRTGDPHVAVRDAFLGGFLYVQKDGFENVHFSLRAHETSMDRDDPGFTVPIIRREDVKAGAVSTILDVPSARADRRTLLRVYDLEARNTAVAVRFVTRENVVLHEQIVGLTVNPGNPAAVNRSEEFPTAPTFAFLQLEDLPLPAALDGFRIEMEPVDPESRIWGFLTITSNETHRVSLLIPQP
jgi:hypothetical protein